MPPKANSFDKTPREDPMAEHEHGSMDIKDQERTFDGFVKFTTYTVIGILVFLVFLALVNG